MTTIIIKNSSTSSAVPVSGDLTKGELAVNVTDKKLYTKDNGGSVVKLVGGLGNQEASAVAITGGAIDGTPIGATTASTASFTTLSASGNVTLSGGTANGVLYLNGSKVATSGSALTFDGTTFQNTGPINTSNNFVSKGTAIFFGDGADNSAAVYATGGPVKFYANASEGMRLTSTGLGIGTSSPGTKLTIAQNGGSNNQYIQLVDTQTSGVTWQIANYATNALGMFGLYNATAGAYRLLLSGDGNLGLGVTPSAWDAAGSGGPVLQIKRGLLFGADTETRLIHNAYYGTGDFRYIATGVAATNYQQQSGQHRWYTAASGTAGDAITFSQVMTLTAGGNLLVGTTGLLYNAERLSVYKSGNAESAAFVNDAGANNYTVAISNRATTGDNKFVVFATESSDTTRGSIVYNRGTGLVTYATTSDYRAKDIIGPVADSGAVIDSVPVYMGKMKGATQERPMFIAHETPAYAHIGEKDAVDEDGSPVFQQMDASSLIPVMWAEIQSLRARVAQLETKGA